MLAISYQFLYRERVKDMQRHFFILVLLLCSVLLAGCDDYVGKENSEETEQTEETEQQMSVNSVSEEDILEIKESEPTTEKEIPENWSGNRPREAGYRLVNIVYGKGEIFAFYVNEEIDDLYISKVQPG